MAGFALPPLLLLLQASQLTKHPGLSPLSPCLLACVLVRPTQGAPGTPSKPTHTVSLDTNLTSPVLPILPPLGIPPLNVWRWQGNSIAVVPAP
ncbi:hypothetical protein C7212DRAFT_304466 [Tuber magnatum]|uniref:Uncharacterized protein n=1 Tax=Tuber magnatum TaxID=42249 RepID=A0A317SY89_9PEZI|nr:hypothetical protein C7212DRAFT_304466 [Tuber magnatum]